MPASPSVESINIEEPSLLLTGKAGLSQADPLGPPKDYPSQHEHREPLFDLSESTSPHSEIPAINGLPSIAAHRARVTMPRVKVADDPELGKGMDGAIATKPRLLGQPATSGTGDTTRTPRPKGLRRQSKNRASVLTFEKGELKSVKGKFAPPEFIPPSGSTSTPPNKNGQGPWNYAGGPGDDTMEVEDVLSVDTPIQKVPTGQELLQMAGLNGGDAEDLPDFEDPVEEVPPVAEDLAAKNRCVYLMTVMPTVHQRIALIASLKQLETFSLLNHPRCLVHSPCLGSALQSLTHSTSPFSAANFSH